MQTPTIYRNAPLTSDEFQRLDAEACKLISFRDREITTVDWKKDEYGDLVQYRKPIAVGMECFLKSTDFEARKMESILRPATDIAIGVHIANLDAHKPYARGGEGLETITRDLVRDLAGKSEYAILKVFEKYRRDPSGDFFPNTGKLYTEISDLDFSLRALAKGKEPETPKKQENAAFRESPASRTEKQKRRVSRLVKLATRKTLSKWEARFMKLTRERAAASA